MIRIIDSFHNADEILWSALNERASNGSFFQTPAYFRFLKKTVGHDPFVFIGAKEGSYSILIMGSVQYSSSPLVKKFSRRAIVNGGLVTDPEADADDITAFLTYLSKSLSKRAMYLEIRNLNDYSAFNPLFDAAGFSRVAHLNYQVSVNSSEDAFRHLSQSRRRQVRKSLDGGAKVVVSNSVEEIEAFYSILRETYRRKVKRPLPPKDFFLKFRESGLGVYILVRYKGGIIGGIMCPVYGRKALYEWYIAGEDGKYPGIYPSVLATWSAIEYAATNNIGIFDFMGAGRPDESYGVREFKARFGGTEVEYGRYLRIFNKMVYKAGTVIFRR
ncbi:MAG TPA: GNAT family N-acetyltransferase [Bacteroidales bacterium]|nr:GNAT family N-acetyltransferase [Bacteroidales bacterium]HQK71454.1 GNAT family N-acetyltransferase [Bacteroidales bacterium]